jgi:hypothetical protein
MIVSALMLLIFNKVNGILSALPSVSTSNPFLASVATASGYLTGLNWIIPVDTIIAILLFYVSFEAFYLLFKVVYWIIRRFPTQS